MAPRRQQKTVKYDNKSYPKTFVWIKLASPGMGGARATSWPALARRHARAPRAAR